MFDNICLTASFCSSIWHLVPVHIFFVPVFWTRCFHNRGGGEKTGRANQSFTFSMNKSHEPTKCLHFSLIPIHSKDFWHKQIFSKPAPCPLGFWAFTSHFWILIFLDVYIASAFQSFLNYENKITTHKFYWQFFNQQEMIQPSPKTSLVSLLLKHANIFSWKADV